MKPFTLKEEKLSSQANIKILSKLYIMKCKKIFSGLKNMKILMPLFAVGFLAIGVFNISPIQTSPAGEKVVNIQETSITNSQKFSSEFKKIRANKYRVLAKKRTELRKAEKYKQYAMLRTSVMRK